MAATFSGNAVTDDRIEVGTPDVPGGTGDFTIMGWFKPGSTFGTKRIASKAVGASDENHTWMLSLNSSGNVLRSRLNAGGSTTTVSAGALTADVWQHGAMIYDSVDDLNYLDGPPNAGSAANSGNVEIDATAEYWIGSQPPNDAADEVFDGPIEDVRIYTRELKEEELETILNCNGHDGIVHELILHHRLNDNSSGTIGAGDAKDTGSLQVNGSGVNGPTWSVGENIMAPRRRYR